MTNIILIFFLKFVFGIIPGISPELSWTLTTLVYNIVCFYCFLCLFVHPQKEPFFVFGHVGPSTAGITGTPGSKEIQRPGYWAQEHSRHHEHSPNFGWAPHTTSTWIHTHRARLIGRWNKKGLTGDPAPWNMDLPGGGALALLDRLFCHRNPIFDNRIAHS